MNDGSNSILNKLSKLQRRAARVITGQSCEVCSTQILESLNWIPIVDTFKNRETTMTFKVQNYDYLQNFFTKSENCNYSLRSNNTK